MIIVYVTCKDKDEARKIGRALVDEKLAACANYFPVNSIFFWSNKIEESGEIVLLLKTRKENWERIKKAVRDMHSYELPCIIKFNVEANSDYEQWINENS